MTHHEFVRTVTECRTRIEKERADILAALFAAYPEFADVKVIEWDGVMATADDYAGWAMIRFSLACEAMFGGAGRGRIVNGKIEDSYLWENEFNKQKDLQ